MLGNNIRKIRKEKKLSINALSKISGISLGYISDLENNKAQNPTTDKLKIIAKALNTSIDEFFKDDITKQCKECGYQYRGNSSNEYKMHEICHNAYKRAVKKFGSLYQLTEREDMKKKSREILKNDNSSFEEKFNASLSLFKAYFSRSLSTSSYNENHVNFADFVAMLLNQEFCKDDIPDDVYAKLIKQFGIKPGIKKGSSYYEFPNETNSDLSYIDTIAAHFEGKKITPKKMKLIEQYIDALFDNED